MKKEGILETYKLLYRYIIHELLCQVCNANINYSVQHKIGNDEMHIALWKKFEEYKERALENMQGSRLDRHKLASCICGAIIETKPLVGLNGATIIKKANEAFALYVGLNVIKYYMMCELLKGKGLSTREEKATLEYLKSNFDMDVPPAEENICDTQDYKNNITNALFWSHHKCEILKKECFHYDIWAYSTVFYHLEKHNRQRMEKVYQDYVEKHKELNK